MEKTIACITILLLLQPVSAGLSVPSDSGTFHVNENLSENSSLQTSLENPSLWGLFDSLKSKEYVDLTHSFRPGIPHWDGFPNETVEAIFNYSTSGFLTQKFSIVGQWGTHVDAPAHFHRGRRTVDQIDVKEMLLPLVVLDIHEKVLKNPDYAVSMDDVSAWQSRHGQIPQGCFVALRTDWSKRWPNQTAMLNRDRNGTFHYPGWSMPVLKYLYEDRKITASGHETTDTDPGQETSKDDYTLESYLLGADHFQIELLANLDRVPEYGAIIVAAFPKPEGGSGFPARVFAILP
ncbi:MAG: Kynurenine formamidase [Methanosaeta sp. PtaU1.Bin112]|nr:MAG: Kynurenine formamidase [Methanosaeta sp. PtaU1.Bin112]